MIFKGIVSGKSFSIPVVFLLIFYFYYGFIIRDIYQFYYGSWDILLLAPRLFFESFVLIFLYSLIFILFSINKQIFKVTLIIFFIAFSSILLIQYFALFYSGNFLIKAALVDYHAAGIYLSVENVIKVLIFLILIIGIVLYLFLRQDIKRPENVLGQVLACFLLFSLSYSSYYLYQKTSRKYASSYIAPAESPEMAFVTLFKKQPIKHVELFDEESDLLEQEYGIRIEKSEFPLQKEWIYKKPLPFESVSSTKQPNFIIFFIESLSSRFLTPYNSRFENITPNIQAFSEKATRIEGYYNHTTPTLNGLTGQLCSLYPQFENRDFENNNYTFQTKSLIDVFAENHYKSNLFCYENKGFPLYRIMNKMGFDNLFFKQDLEIKYDLESERNDYLSDKVIIESLIKYLKTEQDTVPFISVISTVNTHVGFELEKGAARYPYLDNSLLDAYYNFDYNFGKFWDYFTTSKFSENTIVILTADHSLPISPDLAHLTGKDRKENPFWDELAFIVYNPIHDMPKNLIVHNSSISLAPTVLHLASIQYSQNSLQGISIFENPVQEKFLSLYADNLFIKEVNKTFTSVKNDSLLEKWSLFNKNLYLNNKIFNSIHINNNKGL